MFRQPAHPYTRALLDAIPHLSPGPRAHRHPRLDAGAGARARPAAGSTTAASTSRTGAGEVEPEDARGRPGPHGEVHARRRDRHLGHLPRQQSSDTDPHTQRDIILTHRGPRASSTAASRSCTTSRFDVGQGRGGRAGRRVRQRQDHDLALRRRPAQGVDRRASTFEGSPAGPGLAHAQRRGPQADPVHLPEPVPVAEPAADHRADRQAADGAVRHREGQGGPRPGGGAARRRWRSARPCSK